MQDNEFDNLFRSKLNGLEVEPDAHVWNNIAAELGERKKSSVIPMLRIAASVIVVLAAGTWFAVTKFSNSTNTKASNTIASTQVVKPVKEPVVKEDVKETKASEVIQEQIIPVSKMVRNRMPKSIVKMHKVVTIEKATNTTAVTEPLITQPEQLAVVKEPVKMQPVLPDVQLTIKSDEVETIQPKVVNTLASVPESVNPQTKKPAKKHGIHSFGDLINVVVAKVDKREDKVIEFSNTDDDEATITGVNLGIIKVKKEK